MLWFVFLACVVDGDDDVSHSDEGAAAEEADVTDKDDEADDFENDATESDADHDYDENSESAAASVVGGLPSAQGAHTGPSIRDQLPNDAVVSTELIGFQCMIAVLALIVYYFAATRQGRTSVVVFMRGFYAMAAANAAILGMSVYALTFGLMRRVQHPSPDRPRFSLQHSDRIQAVTLSDLRLEGAEYERFVSRSMQHGDDDFMSLSDVCAGVGLLFSSLIWHVCNHEKHRPPAGFFLAMIICFATSIGVPKHSSVIDYSCTRHMIHPDLYWRLFEYNDGIQSLVSV